MLRLQGDEARVAPRQIYIHLSETSEEMDAPP